MEKMHCNKIQVRNAPVPSRGCQNFVRMLLYFKHMCLLGYGTLRTCIASIQIPSSPPMHLTEQTTYHTLTHKASTIIQGPVQKRYPR